MKSILGKKMFQSTIAWFPSKTCISLLSNKFEYQTEKIMKIIDPEHFNYREVTFRIDKLKFCSQIDSHFYENCESPYFIESTISNNLLFEHIKIHFNDAFKTVDFRILLHLKEENEKFEYSKTFSDGPNIGEYEMFCMNYDNKFDISKVNKIIEKLY